MSFINKVVIITGAGSGLGEATAKSFAKLSAKLALLDKNAENLKKIKDYCEELSNNRVLATVADVSKDEDINRAIESIHKEFGRVDVLVNCAGRADFSGILNTNLLKEYDDVMNVNLRSVVAITHRVAPMLVETKGCVVNICSIAAMTVYEYTIPYSVSKAGLRHLTKCVALELASKGVRVNSVSPGLVKTNLFTNSGVHQTDSDEYYNKMAKQIPLKRLVDAKEVADVVVFLASDVAKGITGADFVIDAGFLLEGSKLQIEDIAKKATY